MKKIRLISTITLLLTVTTLFAAAPKREFRGAWIQAVNHQFEAIPTAELKRTLISQLDSLEKARINTILFQIRVEGDALYKSEIEPWSKYLTGKQGQAPDEDWDPLQFMIDECHKRGMELHAWINPFRAQTASTKDLSPMHQISQHPDRFIKYGSLVLFNPAIQENCDHICKVAADITRRYDIDGFHMDDYFYPYPDGNLKFNDDAWFKADNRGFTDKADWRRDNVNRFVEQIRDTIKTIKPWVRFGISPFGIYRNSSPSYHNGSLTNGLENYSGLYADILYWIEKGWMDYCIPQVYWNTGHKTADYSVLTKWWSENAGNCVMVIGQDVDRTITGTDPGNRSMHQQRHKLNLERIMPGLQGNCFWYAKAVVDNVGNYRTILTEEYHQYPALQPVAPTMSQDAPGKVRKVMCLETTDGPVLFWTPSKYNKKKIFEKPVKYVIYRFNKDEQINIEDPSRIITITDRLFINLPYKDGTTEYVYVVTALNRLQVESAPVKCKIKL